MIAIDKQRKVTVSKKPLQAISIDDIERRLRAESKIDNFYFEFFFPAIPVGMLRSCEIDYLVLYLQNIVHLVGKRLVNERSILDNSLAYKNLSVSQVEKSTTKRKHK